MASPIKQCTFCGSGSLTVLGGSYAHAHLSRCHNCGLVFSAMMPTDEELYTHYLQYPRGGTISEITVARYNELLDGFEAYRSTNRILDVGCGDGFFLEVARKRGWEVQGTEFDPVAVRVCTEKGIPVFSGKLQQLKTEKEFDVICSFEVLEHIHNGAEEVECISRLLRKGGLFYFTTPNFNSFSRKWLGGKWTVIGYPEHLTYYSVKTMRNLLRKQFIEQKIITTGISVQRIAASRSGSDEGTAGKDEALRSKMEKPGLMRFVKNTANAVLRLFRSGDTIKGWYTRS